MVPVREEPRESGARLPAGAERRHHRRYEFPGATVEFGFPGPLGQHREQPLKDLSLGGIAFFFDAGCCLDRLRVGRVLHGIRLRVDDRVVDLDMLVMRVQPAGDGRMLCGGFAYWKTLENFGVVKELLAAAERKARP